MGSYLGLAKGCDNGKMSVPFLVTAMESSKAMIQCEGTAMQYSMCYNRQKEKLQKAYVNHRVTQKLTIQGIAEMCTTHGTPWT